MSLQICAFTPETCQAALRDIIKHTAQTAVIRWSIDGWQPKSEPGAMAARNLLGFRDGTGNPKVSDPKTADEVLWTGVAANSLDEPEWAKNGSYQAVRLIRRFVEFWGRTPLQEQTDIFGRRKYSGAPMDGKKKPTNRISPKTPRVIPRPKTAICAWRIRAIPNSSKTPPLPPRLQLFSRTRLKRTA